MMYISVLFIVIVSFSSYISRRISFMSLVFLLPFYTISREILSSGLVVLIWPYIWISALALVTIIKSKNINNKYPIYLIVLTLLITILSLLLVSKGFSRIHTENITFIFSKVELVLLVSFALFYFLLFIRGFFLEIKSSGKSVTYLDWIILVFFLYGFAHIYLTLIKDRDIFNAILGFRYYFSSAIVYFLARILVVNKKEISIIFFIMLAAIGLAIIFMFFESVFLNMLKIDSARLPWNRGILSEVFNYSPSQITFLDAYGGAPQGVMFMTHLSGVFSLFGFALLLPFFYSLDKIQDNRYRAFIILFILFAPLSFIYTSKTTIILYYLVIVVTAFFQFKYWKKSLWIVPLFAILVPIIYSYNLLPGMKYDFGRAISYIVSPQTATNQIIDEFNEDIIIKEKQNAGFFYKGNNNNRVLNNAFFYLRNSILSDILINRSIYTDKGKFNNIYLGNGYQLSEWNRLRENSKMNSNEYKLDTKSDTPYLNFYFQFGAIGALLLLLVQFSSLLYPLLAFNKSNFILFNGLSAGLFSVIFIEIIGMGHLQLLFKTGLNSYIFIIMALGVQIYRLEKDSIENNN